MDNSNQKLLRSRAKTDLTTAGIHEYYALTTPPRAEITRRGGRLERELVMGSQAIPKEPARVPTEVPAAVALKHAGRLTADDTLVGTVPPAPAS